MATGKTVQDLYRYILPCSQEADKCFVSQLGRRKYRSSSSGCVWGPNRSNWTCHRGRREAKGEERKKEEEEEGQKANKTNKGPTKMCGLKDAYMFPRRGQEGLVLKSTTEV